MKNIIKTMLMMLLAGTIITACDKKTEYPEPNTTAAVLPAQTANFRIMHTSTDSPEMKFFINNLIFKGNATGTLSYGQQSLYASADITAIAGATGPASNTRLNTTVSDMTKILFRYPGLDGVTRDIKDVLFRTTSSGVMGTGNFAAAAGESYSVFYTDETTRPASPDARTGRSTDIGGPLLDYILADRGFITFSAPTSMTTTKEVRLRLAHLSSPPPRLDPVNRNDVRVTIGGIADVTNAPITGAFVSTILPRVPAGTGATGVEQNPTAITQGVFPITLFDKVRFRDLHLNPRPTIPAATIPAGGEPFREYRSISSVRIPIADANNTIRLKNILVTSAGGSLPVFDLDVDVNKAYTLVAIGTIGVTTGPNKFEIKVIAHN